MDIIKSVTRNNFFTQLENAHILDDEELQMTHLWRQTLDRALLDLKVKTTRQDVLDWLESDEFEVVCELAHLDKDFCLKIFNKFHEEILLQNKK